jgi:hypothetical protein
MDHVSGGVQILEVKLGQDALWHVHLHCLLEGQYLDQRQLSAEWYATTGDSFIVDVRRCGEGEVKYAAAYAGKPLDASIFADEGKLDEAVVALKGVRLVTTFGEWRGLDVDAPDPDAPTDWVTVAPLCRLLNDARRGDRWALALLGQLTRHRPIEAPCEHDPGDSPAK